MKFTSPLRYPGGKSRLTEFMALILKKNDLLGGEYVEPYAGGCGIALNLLLNDLVGRIHINDIDLSVYSFWRSVLYNTDELCRMIYDCNIDIKTWKQQKEIQKVKNSVSALELGFSTFFLNRTNRSGIINAGVIGGLAQKGEWKLDARFNKKQLVHRIEKIALYKNNISLYNYDAIKMIDEIFPTFSPKTLIYFDPPYFVKGRELYQNHYNELDHTILHDSIISKVKQFWIVSYDNVDQIKCLYKNLRSIVYTLNYSAGKASQGREIIVFSDKLIIPTIDNPAQLKVA